MELFMAFIWALIGLAAIALAFAAPRLADLIVPKLVKKKPHRMTAGEAAREVAGMKGRATIIKIGDPQIAGALVDGVVNAEVERLRKENEHLKAELGVLKARDAAQWQERIARNRRAYRRRKAPRWAQKMLAAWAGLTMGVRA